MRLGKRERARLRQSRLENFARQARVARAGTPVRIFTSNDILTKGIPVGRASFQWGWRWQEHAKAVKAGHKA